MNEIHIYCPDCDESELVTTDDGLAIECVECERSWFKAALIAEMPRVAAWMRQMAQPN